jgi:DNA-binding NtrC family response regulator
MREAIVAETREALKAENGNRTRAAKRLGLSRAAIVARLNAHPELSREFPAKTGRPEKRGDT